MSYAIVKVIYGVPLTKKCIDLLNKWENEEENGKWWEDDNGPCGFYSVYTAGGPGNGFCGVELDELDSYENQLVKKVNMEPSKAQKKKAEEMVANLDPQLRKAAGEIGTYFIWSDS